MVWQAHITRFRFSVLLAIALSVASVAGAFAHEARPAFLSITETAANKFDVLWRTPLLSGMRLPVALKFPDSTRNVTEPSSREFADSLVERRLIEVPEGLAGQRIQFLGLQATITDVLVRVQTLDGALSTTLVRPSQPWVEIAVSRGPMAIAGAYLAHGVEHILLGFDHLLFVLALVLIVRSTRVLLITVTAFTLAHSITLSLATLGLVKLPGPPVEAVIALSILLLACEIIRSQRGQESLTARWPWVVAFTFGLLHGFGFAGALTEIGLPPGDVPLALFAFNLGVELGQLAFIGAVLGVLALARWLKLPAILERRALSAATYAIGALAAFWFIERLAGLIA